MVRHTRSCNADGINTFSNADVMKLFACADMHPGLNRGSRVRMLSCVAIFDSSWNGVKPVSSSYAKTPTAQTST